MRWIALVTGFGGMHRHNSTIGFAPRLPEGISRLAFTVTVRGRRLRVEITDSTASYVLAEGEPLEILHYGEPLDRIRGAAARPADPGGDHRPVAEAAAGARACPPDAQGHAAAGDHAVRSLRLTRIAHSISTSMYPIVMPITIWQHAATRGARGV